MPCIFKAEELLRWCCCCIIEGLALIKWDGLVQCSVYDEKLTLERLDPFNTVETVSHEQATRQPPEAMCRGIGNPCVGTAHDKFATRLCHRQFNCHATPERFTEQDDVGRIELLGVHQPVVCGVSTGIATCFAEITSAFAEAGIIEDQESRAIESILHVDDVSATMAEIAAVAVTVQHDTVVARIRPREPPGMDWPVVGGGNQDVFHLVVRFGTPRVCTLWQVDQGVLEAKCHDNDDDVTDDDDGQQS